jgi:hypothetical protein
MAYSFVEVVGKRKKNFKLKKKVIRLISRVEKGTSWKELSKTINIFSVPYVYIMEIRYCLKLNLDEVEQKLKIIA